MVLIVLAVELRSGLSVLAALQTAADRLPDQRSLGLVARVATVSGLTTAIEIAPPPLRPLVSQLARAQSSGASLTATVRRMLEQDLAADRARRLSRARSLPVRLMVPLTLLVLPGLVLLVYGPSLLALFRDLTGTWP